MVKIGVNPIVWSNDDDHSLGGDISFEQCLSEARAAGFEGIELGHKFPQDPQVLQGALAEAQLQLVSGWWSTRLLERTVIEEVEALEAHMNLLIAMGCDTLIAAEVTGTVHPVRDIHWSRRPCLHPNALSTLAEDLTELGAYVGTRGLQLVYHHHVGTVIQSASDIDKLMRGSGDEVGLLVDTGHAVVAGVSPVELLRSHARRVKHVHLKDVRAGPLETAGLKQSCFLEAVAAGMFTVPGDGMIDWTPIFEELRRNDYAQWLVVEAEQDPMQAPPARYARMGYKFVRRLCEEAGL
jgi:inosose dehydratase